MKASLLTADDPRYIAAAEARELVTSGRATAEYNEDVEGPQDPADADTPF